MLVFLSRLVPRHLAIWGFIGASGIVANVFVSQPAPQAVLVLPIIVHEIYLGCYLLVKGLRVRA
ncbi:MAG TPA: DUF4386 family protein [Arachnia sp.]|nr:DUF4386 family protein [Arachnia sp.]HMT85640.1 DUF4386 family protein [Arachnia sp.]